MACSCSRNHCSCGCSNCNNGYARVNYGNCRNGCNSWKHWHCNNNCNNCNNCNSCNCSGCGCNHCGHNGHCGCNSTCSTCSFCCDTWNNGRSGCGNSSACGNYGVLRSVAGPYFRPPHFPFYTGPCGPCADDCCNDCCSSCCDDCCDDCCETCCDDCCTSASFIASTPVELAAGDGVELECTSENLNDFTVTQDGIRIHRAGNYMVIYTIHVPANETVSSRFVLALNGDRIAASAADVCSVADGTTNGYSMHAMVRADAGDLLKLVSLSPVSICASSASNVFTLSITRIG